MVGDEQKNRVIIINEKDWAWLTHWIDALMRGFDIGDLNPDLLHMATINDTLKKARREGDEELDHEAADVE